MNKKGIELSINFLVVTIISVTILALGIVLLRSMFTNAEDLTATIDKSIEAELRTAVSQGKSVYVYPRLSTIKAADDQVFGISVLNILSTSIDRCKPVVTCSEIYNMDNSIASERCTSTALDANEWVLNPSKDSGGTTIESREDTTFPIMIKPKEDAVKDRIYAYDFKISCLIEGVQKDYGTPQKVYLTIK